MGIDDLKREKERKELLFQRLREEDVEEAIENKVKFFEKKRNISFSLVFFYFALISLGFYFLVQRDLLFFNHTGDLLENELGIIGFISVTALFGFSGGVARQFYSLFQYNWKVGTFKEKLEMEPFLGNPDPLNYQKILRFINSSPHNILFIRPIFIPPLGAITAIFSTIAIYQFDLGLARVAIVGFPAGIIAKDIIFALINKAHTLLNF